MDSPSCSTPPSCTFSGPGFNGDLTNEKWILLYAEIMAKKTELSSQTSCDKLSAVKWMVYLSNQWSSYDDESLTTRSAIRLPSASVAMIGLFGETAVKAKVGAEKYLSHIHTRLRDGALPIWIDAVCINQGDGNEKTTQVREMSAIYSGAKLVIAWLGLAGDGSDVAFTKLHRIGRFQAARHTSSGTSAQHPLGGPLRCISQPLLPILTSAPSLMRSTFHTSSSDAPKQPLAELPRATTDKWATDKRDYVFGVLAMAMDLKELGIEADYTKTCL
ncbi:heterokaryon incompatibility protein-domain-containing protein [Phialemonium atrogriseum]|uniref:Heterokaryon incompatibility protein-domain-containing protein n=1 Tax=Phialemonium atrogriseum TaxID=1093897 RepID=A0AAJ0BT22_9PEZI|nr:heterokaryon incompatibility protein-domain-containing protein [Phialemonium atrogriseum]KAK1763780.1 heterokaryon incompatibility protein-domain-containing protein [Phialemonium atrogriseum]